MPISQNPSRQETTLWTTSLSDLVGIWHPLPQKLLTTIFMLPFIFHPLNLLHIFTIFPNSQFCTFSKSQSHFSDIRRYVANPSCNLGRLQYSSLSCRRPFQPAIFNPHSPSIAKFFCIYSTLPLLTSKHPVILPALCPLNWTFLPPFLVTIVCLCLDQIPKFAHRKRYILNPQNPA